MKSGLPTMQSRRSAKRTQTHSETAHKKGCRCASLCWNLPISRLKHIFQGQELTAVFLRDGANLQIFLQFCSQSLENVAIWLLVWRITLIIQRRQMYHVRDSHPVIRVCSSVKTTDVHIDVFFEQIYRETTMGPILNAPSVGDSTIWTDGKLISSVPQWKSPCMLCVSDFQRIAISNNSIHTQSEEVIPVFRKGEFSVNLQIIIVKQNPEILSWKVDFYWVVLQFEQIS